LSANCQFVAGYIPFRTTRFYPKSDAATALEEVREYVVKQGLLKHFKKPGIFRVAFLSRKTMK